MKYSVSNHKAILSISKKEWDRIGRTTKQDHIITAHQNRYVTYKVVDTKSNDEFSQIDFSVNSQPGKNGYFYQEFFKDESGMPKKEMVSPNGRYKAILINDGGLNHASTN
ncbi:MAG: hypothetical protein WC375_04330 [Methanomassiliicoccales archaeon]|jgi:hypothetical protein